MCGVVPRRCGFQFPTRVRCAWMVECVPWFYWCPGEAGAGAVAGPCVCGRAAGGVGCRTGLAREVEYLDGGFPVGGVSGDGGGAVRAVLKRPEDRGRAARRRGHGGRGAACGVWAVASARQWRGCVRGREGALEGEALEGL